MKFGLLVPLIAVASMGNAQQLVITDSLGWNAVREGQGLAFSIHAQDLSRPYFTLEGVNGIGMQLDSLGNFLWKPGFDLVDRLEKQKEITVIVQAEWKDGKRIRKSLTFVLTHQNRPPIAEDLPVFYVRQSIVNRYQIPTEYVTDPDGDPLVFKSIQSQLPEGVTLSSLGMLTWTPSRNQFNNLKNNPLQLEFIVQDQPEKAETRGKIKIAQTQLDLPPEILLVPGDSTFTIKEDERINLKIYVSDPNGDEDIKSVGFVTSDARISTTNLIQNTIAQSEFTWTPGYFFVEDPDHFKKVEIIFFTLDKSNNRMQRKVSIKIEDTENLDEKDKSLYQRYRNSIIQAKSLIDLLDQNHEKLNKAYKQAKRGKKHRAIINASLGATTGLSPVVLQTDPSKIVSAIGGTTVLTLGTLEATEVIGKSKNDITEKLKVNVEIRNQLQVEGDNFARKYSLKGNRRSKEFDVDRDKLLPLINSQKLVILELDGSKPGFKNYENREIKKTFPDFSDQ